MTFNEIMGKVEGKIIYDSGNADHFIDICCSSDLMSDILTLDGKKHAILITGLSTVQALRTAEMADINHVLIVREKPISSEMIQLAQDLGITLAVTPRPMFTVCGILYQEKLKPAY